MPKPLFAVTVLAVFAALLSAKTLAGTIYVDALAGSCGTYNPTNRSCAGGTENVFGTIREASAAAGAGTTVLIRGGAYNEQLSPATSGAVSNCITFKNYPGEEVFLTGSPAISLSGRSCIIIEGLRVEDTTWLEARDSHSNVLRNCVFKRTPAVGTTGNARFVQSHFNRIEGNVFENGHDNLLLIDANYNVVVENTFREGRHSLIGIRCGDFNVIRSNYFSNSLQKIAEVYDCGHDTSAVPHSFDSTKHNVFEKNVFADASSYYSASGGNGIQYSGQEGIIRHNVFYRCNVGLGMQVYSDEALYVNKNSTYHNVFYANEGAGISVWNAPSNTYKNNVLLGNLGSVPDCFALSPGQVIYRTSFGAGSVFDNNAILYQMPAQPVIEVEFNTGQSLTEFNIGNPGVFVNTLEAEPQFVNAAAYDFHLRSTSPMIGAGAFLTKTTSAGAGTTMTVEDPFHFFDGFGIPGERGDVVQLEGQTVTARIARVDYSNKTLTLDRSLTWTNGQNVSLEFRGRAPDIGTFEYHSPELKMRRAGDALILSWPSAAGAFRLEATDSLTEPQWQASVTPVLKGDEWSVTNSITSDRQFFRLVN